MVGPIRAQLATKLLLPLACLTCAWLAVPAAATAVVHFQRESFPAFEQQLSAGQIESATFNKKAHTLHLLLKDGRYMLISYPSHQEPQLAARLRARGIAVTVEKSKAKPAVHHKLRYIAGGILLVVIAVVVAVLLVDRRRRLGQAGADRGSTGASAASPGDSS
jgi:hypothetical protein